MVDHRRRKCWSWWKCRSIAAAWIACALSVLAPVAASQAPSAVEFNIPAQSLEQSLRQLADSQKLQLVFSPSDVRGLAAPALKGRYTIPEALAKLTESTGLTYSFDGKDTVVIKPAGTTGGAAGGPALSAQGQSPGAASGKEGDGTAAGEIRIEVTGSRVKRAEVEGALPVNVYTKEDIVHSGQSSLADFLNTLNEVSVVSSNSSNFQITTGQPTVQLRGLPAGMTLVLLNGRRIEGTATSGNGQLVNLNLIPLAAIERIEILPVAASAIYGGDALAGVVNIILKQSYDGVMTDARYGHASGIDDSAVSAVVGKNGPQGNILAIASYSQNSPLRGDERDITNNADYRRFGGPDRRVQTCNPGTVSSTTSANLPGLNGTVAGIPNNPSGARLSPGDFTALVGMPNLCSPTQYQVLIAGTRTASAFLSGDYAFSPYADLFGELLYTNWKQDTRRGGTSLPNISIPASNAFNPFGVTVSVIGRTAPDSVPSIGTLQTEFTRPLVGLRGKLGGTWDYEISISTGRDHGTNIETNQVTNFAAQATALASSDPATAFNAFTTGQAGSPDVLSAIYSNREYHAEGKRDVAVGFVRGSLFNLPAGSLDVIVGAEYNHDHLSNHDNSTGQVSDLGRYVHSYFGELRVPILRGVDTDKRPFEALTLTAAARHDDYSDFGTANTTAYGIEWRPVRSLLIRAVRSEAFKPPLLNELSGQTFDFPSEVFGLIDPMRGGEPIVGANIHFSPTPDLKPETGVAKAVGAVWEPQSVPGLSTSITWWRIDQQDRIIFPSSPQTLLDNEAILPGFVTRGPSVGGQPGLVTNVDWRYLNFGKYLVEGIDYGVSYTFSTVYGQWSPSISATQTTKYDTSLVPGSPVISRLNHPDTEGWAPRWKGRIQLGWQRGPYSAGATGRYVSQYFDYDSTTRKLGDEWYFDFFGAVELGPVFGLSSKALAHSTATLNIVNAFNRLPQYANTNAGYDHYQADIRGRYVAIQLSVPWQ